MPTASEIPRIMARSSQPGRTRNWRRFPARSGQRAERVKPDPLVIAVEFRALTGQPVMELSAQNRTGHEIGALVLIGATEQTLFTAANRKGTAIFEVEAGTKITVHGGDRTAPVLWQGLVLNIGKESFG